jgi:hypothetical protein
VGRLLPLTIVAAGLVALSGAKGADPRTPPALPGYPEPFLSTALIGNGDLTGGIDTYGNLVDLRSPGPAGVAQIRNSAGRQRVGTVPADTGITVAAGAAGREPAPLWTGERLRQQYRGGTNVLETGGSAAGARLAVRDAAHRDSFARRFTVGGSGQVSLRVGVNFDLAGDREHDGLAVRRGSFVQAEGGTRVSCRFHPHPEGLVVREGDHTKLIATWQGEDRLVARLVCSFAGEPRSASGIFSTAASSDRRWLARARSLEPRAPAWAVRMYERSLLVLRALTDRETGALAAGARDLWALVWPRDAAAGALALRAAGYAGLANRVAGFLARIDLESGARFRGDGSPLRDSRGPAGDAAGWASVADGIPGSGVEPEWTDRHDYGEREDDSGDYLGNAIVSGVGATEILRRFGAPHGLVRSSGDPDSGLDSAAAWAVRPFRRAALREPARTTLIALAAQASHFGMRPAKPLHGAWTAPTAWSAWSLAALDERTPADRLLRSLARAATPAGTLPERVELPDGVAISATPLAWSHAFAILALRERYS